ncbi:hypothetical protein D3C85_793460 [compost metagenome]
MQHVGVQFLDPLGHNDGGHGVADQVGQGTGFGHEAVDAEDQRQAGNRQVTDGGQGGGQHDEAGTGDAGGALGGNQQHGQQGQLVGDIHRGVGGLGDEHRGHGQVDGGAVQVEGVAGGDDQADDGLVRAQLFHLVQHARQGRLGRRGAQHDQQLFADVADETQDAEAVRAGDAAQDHQDEEHAGDVEAQHQLAELHQRAHAVLADGEGHGAEGTDGRDLHDHVDDAEHHLGDLVDEMQHRLTVITHALQGEGEDHREEQHLQNIAAGEGADYGAGDHVEQEGDGALLLAGGGKGGNALGVQGGRVDMHADARLHDVHHYQADEQGDGGDDFEVSQRVAAGLAHCLHVLHAGDAADHGAEDDRRDGHLDQLDEAVAQGFERDAGFRIEVAQEDADGDGDNDLDVQALVERLAGHGSVPFE